MKFFFKKILPLSVRLKLRKGQEISNRIYNKYGNSAECPICGYKCRRFDEFNGRKNAMCPKCKSLERHRLLFLFLKNKTDFFNSPSKILHFAPELCFEKIIRSIPFIDYTTADLMTSFLGDIEMEPDVVMSVTDIKFDDNLFDVVLCNHVLEHVQEDRTGMREIKRVLKKGGYAILQVPINYNSFETFEDFSLGPEQRKKQYGEVDHVRLYGLDYKDRLEDIGFKVIPVNYVQEVDYKRYVLDPRETLYQCFSF